MPASLQAQITLLTTPVRPCERAQPSAAAEAHGPGSERSALAIAACCG